MIKKITPTKKIKKFCDNCHSKIKKNKKKIKEYTL